MGYKGEIPATHHGDSDVCLDRGGGVVYWILVNPSSDEWDLIIRDGGASDAEVLIQLIDAAESARLFPFSPPLPYEKGLFVDLVTDVRNFTICYDHLES